MVVSSCVFAAVAYVRSNKKNSFALSFGNGANVSISNAQQHLFEIALAVYHF